MRMWLLAAGAAWLSGPALAAEPSAPPPTAIPAEPEHGFTAALAPAYITDLQQQLVARGYYAGPVDGRVNGALRAAVSVYQSDVGLRVTGVPDLAVLNMLRYGPDVRATIQPLGAPGKPAAAPAAARGGVPPYEKVEPYRYMTQPEPPAEDTEAIGCDGPVNVLRPPAPRAERRDVRAEEPPLPKPAPQARVVAQPLISVGR